LGGVTPKKVAHGSLPHFSAKLWVRVGFGFISISISLT